MAIFNPSIVMTLPDHREPMGFWTQHKFISFSISSLHGFAPATPSSTVAHRSGSWHAWGRMKKVTLSEKNNKNYMLFQGHIIN